MEPLATLPVFFKLKGRTVVMVGGGEPAVWKAELIAATGAAVRVYAPDPCAAMLGLAAEGQVTLIGRAWTPEDLTEAAMAIGAIEEEAEAVRFRDAAHGAGVPVNVVDKPAFCDFQFGTIVARSPLVIGISTDGAAPVFGQALRARIEALLPDGLRHWAEAARDWRPAVQARALDFRRRRRFWELFTERALAEPERQPSMADQAACLAAVDDKTATPAQGRLTLVGAGLGDARSMTLGAIGALQSADLVVYDAGIGETCVALSRREAEKRRVVDLPTDRLGFLKQAIDHGLHVAWLATSDPLLCDRWRDIHALATDIGLAPILERGLALCPDCPVACRHSRSRPA